jgi:SAM-dependent methyltransferase
MRSRGARPLFYLSIVVSSLLLFLIQPIMAKAILPSFGGTAGVWVTAMMFFETVLLMGYFYAWLSNRFLSRRGQGIVHVVLLALSLTMLPARPHLKAMGPNPSLAILLVLAASIGLPYLLLSASSPLFQSWYTGVFPYRLFAVSNAGSLIALLAFPFVVEPLLTTHAQLAGWSAGYGLFVLMAGFLALQNEGRTISAFEHGRPFLWISLAACASALWMAVANHLSQQVAPVPFLWVLPLSIYLLTFILCFDERRSFYNAKVFRFLLPPAWIAGAYSIANTESADIRTEIVLFSLALFVWCMFCHGELARSKPEDRSGLTFFYLMLAFGGALGGVFVALVAPNVFSTYLELPIGVVASVILALRVYGVRSNARLIRIGVLAAAAFVIATRFQIGAGKIEHLRNFYGAIQVSDEDGYRSLYNGKTLHGVEFLAPDRLLQPTAYYGPESGAGRILAAGGKNRRVALVGLGAGTLAAYGREGDSFQFYEINPAVVRIASHDFHFLSASPAHTQIELGDGRLLLAKEPAHSLDVIILDAFSDDSIPVHLLTTQAFELYLRLLKPGGVIAIHVTNRYLDLQPVVSALGAHFHKNVEAVHSPAEPRNQIFVADWALVYGQSDNIHSAGPLWTDDYTNLFGLLRY